MSAKPFARPLAAVAALTALAMGALYFAPFGAPRLPALAALKLPALPNLPALPALPNLPAVPALPANLDAGVVILFVPLCALILAIVAEALWLVYRGRGPAELLPQASASAHSRHDEA